MRLLTEYTVKFPHEEKSLQAALDLANEAQRQDKAHNFQAALDLYIDVLDRLSIILKANDNPNLTKSLRETMASYLTRAEKIKECFPTLTPHLRPKITSANSFSAPQIAPSASPQSTLPAPSLSPAPLFVSQSGMPPSQVPSSSSMSSHMPPNSQISAQSFHHPQHAAVSSSYSSSHAVISPLPSFQPMGPSSFVGTNAPSSSPSLLPPESRPVFLNEMGSGGVSSSNGSSQIFTPFDLPPIGSANINPSPFNLPPVQTGVVEAPVDDSASLVKEMNESDRRGIAIGPGVSGGNGKDKGRECIIVQNSRTGHLERKPMYLTAKLENNEIRPQQRVRLYVEVQNQSSMVIKHLRVSFRRILRNLRTDDKGKNTLRTDKELVKVSDFWQGAVFPLPAEADYKGYLEFDIPRNVPPTNLEHRGFFERVSNHFSPAFPEAECPFSFFQEYELKLECVVTLKRNLAVYIPVVVVDE
jgi:hypothetical protein